MTWEAELAKRQRYVREAKDHPTAMIPAEGWVRIGPIYDGSYSLDYEFMREDGTLADSVSFDIAIPESSRLGVLDEWFSRLKERHDYLFGQADDSATGETR